MEKIRDFILYWDYIIWYHMNVTWQTPFLDAVVPFLRNQWFWVPLYLFLAIFMPVNFKRKGWVWCLVFIMSFALADSISAHLIKPYFHRLRPCNNPYLANVIHILVPCGSGYSFPSAHATNHFSMGMFSAVTLSKKVKWIWIVAITWAILVSYAQVYVGVHFPLDVTCGALLGITIGTFLGKLYNRYFNLANA